MRISAPCGIVMLGMRRRVEESPPIFVAGSRRFAIHSSISLSLIKARNLDSPLFWSKYRMSSSYTPEGPLNTIPAEHVCWGDAHSMALPPDAFSHGVTATGV